MTSQYDIETAISEGRKLVFDFEALKKIKPATKLIKKMIKDKESQIRKQNKKLYKWCEEFDSKIKPLDSIEDCNKPDKIFTARIPNNLEDHQTYVKQYEGFVNKEGYKVEGVDKQKGYISTVYSFFAVKK